MHEKTIKKYIKSLLAIEKELKAEIYLVGGFLRDYILGNVTLDIDCVVSKNAKKAAELFQKKHGGALVVLDEDEETYRIVHKTQAGDYYIDFTTMHGKNLKEDAKRRDFTFNALYWKVSEECDFQNVVDYAGGLKDLKGGIIRMMAESAFKEDSLRIIRAFRFSSQYKFKIDAGTKKVIAQHVELLKNVSQERIHDEWVKICAAGNTFKIIKQMDDIGILDVIFPEITEIRKDLEYYYHKYGLWGHSLEVLYCFEFIINNLTKIFKKSRASFFLEYVKPVNMRVCFILNCLFHDLGKPDTLKIIDEKVRFFGHEEISRQQIGFIMKRLRFSNKDKAVAQLLAKYHMYIGNMVAQAGTVTEKAYYRFFKRAGDAAKGVMLFTLADCLASIRGIQKKSFEDGISLDECGSKNFADYQKFIERIIDWFDKKEKIINKKPIIDGNEIMTKFGLPQSKLIGEILNAIAEARVEGKIKTKKDAYAFVKKFLKQ
ncbi:MAG: hypothetical protein ABH857_02280 [Elusimicrobiota bacterium]